MLLIWHTVVVWLVFSCLLVGLDLSDLFFLIHANLLEHDIWFNSLNVLGRKLSFFIVCYIVGIIGNFQIGYNCDNNATYQH